MTKRITVGLPVYRGAKYIGAALTCLQQQTFREFDAIISVDGNDQETAEACRPYLSDSRFRMVVHQERLDWFGNFNWLLQQELNEFFCYRQHDDTTSPDFFEKLLKLAASRPDAAASFATASTSADAMTSNARLPLKAADWSVSSSNLSF